MDSTGLTRSPTLPVGILGAPRPEGRDALLEPAQVAVLDELGRGQQLGELRIVAEGLEDGVLVVVPPRIGGRDEPQANRGEEGAFVLGEPTQAAELGVGEEV